MIEYSDMTPDYKNLLKVLIDWCDSPVYVNGLRAIANANIWGITEQELLDNKNWAALPITTGQRGPEFHFAFSSRPLIQISTFNWGRGSDNGHDVIINNYVHRPECNLLESWWTKKTPDKIATSECVNIIRRAFNGFDLHNLDIDTKYQLYIDEKDLKRTSKYSKDGEIFRRFVFKNGSYGKFDKDITFDLWIKNERPVRTTISMNGNEQTLTARYD